MSEASEVGVRVSEIYASVQGEGPRTGMGTIFLRFGGCNLRCPGWPCDTLFAVLPEFRADWERRSPGSVLKDVLERCHTGNIANVCLTGGEPFLQNSKALRRIVEGLLEEDISVEAFSNGQIAYPMWTFDKVNFIMDWKLQGSGNPANHPNVLELMLDNIKNLKVTDAIKLVIKDLADYSEAKEVWENYRSETLAQWWAGVVWDGDIKESELVEMIQADSLPWLLNVQVHKYLWSADARGV
jgi:7-carboxy-7-deazaguanine synthase